MVTEKKKKSFSLQSLLHFLEPPCQTTPPPPQAIFNIAALEDRLLTTMRQTHRALVRRPVFNQTKGGNEGVALWVSPLKSGVRRRLGELNISQSSPTTAEVMSLKGCRLARFHLQPEIPLERHFHIQLLKEWLKSGCGSGRVKAEFKFHFATFWVRSPITSYSGAFCCRFVPNLPNHFLAATFIDDLLYVHVSKSTLQCTAVAETTLCVAHLTAVVQ